MDIYSYLKKDHRKVSDMMEQLVAARSLSRREDLFYDIMEELTLHAETEQATFYAALEDADEAAERIEDAEEEHDEIKDYLKRLSNMSMESEKWLITFGELKHAVEHHVEEEEGRVFEKARQVLSDDEAEELAEEMDRLKAETMEHAA